MARSDLVYNIIKYGLKNDKINFIKAVEALSFPSKNGLNSGNIRSNTLVSLTS